MIRIEFLRKTAIGWDYKNLKRQHQLSGAIFEGGNQEKNFAFPKEAAWIFFAKINTFTY